MRVGFGLVALLVTIAIILLLFSIYQAPTLKRGKQAQDQAREFAGRDENNAPVTDAITLAEQDHNGRMEGAVVTSITSGSALQNKYGLQRGDVIVAMGALTVKDHMSSAAEAKDFLLDAYERSQPVVVMRGSEQLTLPMDKATAAAAARRPSPAEPAQQKKKPGGLEGQLDLIRNAPGQ